MAIRTRRWTRSPRGEIFGVVTGLAEWRGLPPSTTRLIVLLITIFTAIFPAVLIYLILAIILPEQTPDDIIGENDYRTFSTRSRRNNDYAEDATFREKSDEDLEKEYENLKKKVETMENDIYDKEKDWDNRFKNS